MARYRIESDTLGKVRVPAHAYYGAQTQRAIDNFPISGLTLQAPFVVAQAIIKRAAALANAAAGRLDPEAADAIVAAADEIIGGKRLDQFKVDVYQAGAGTSQNMNMNEVLANRASELLGGRRGDYRRVHPNDHANLGQSTNDTIHSAMHIAAVVETERRLLPAVAALEKSLAKKAAEFDRHVKMGRTHLQDAVPMRLGQEFGGWAAMLGLSRARVEASLDGMRELALGGTAIGTGLNAAPGYRRHAIDEINRSTNGSFRSAKNLFEAVQSLDAVLAFSGALRALATNAKKIADDIRLLSSGPQAGLAEITIPEVQPGSSIMPGKVNPVMAEMLDMVCFGVFGNDATIHHAALAGQLQLNVMMPVVAYRALDSVQILSAGLDLFTQRCIRGIGANAKTLRRYAERSGALATALSPHIGYNKAAALAKEAVKKNVTVRELAEKKKVLAKAAINKALDLRRMTNDPENE
jgi:fumarate hydratase class II